MSSSQKSLHLKSGQKVVSEAHFHGTKERPQHDSSHRRGSGPQQHRYSAHSRRYGSRKDQDRPSCDWNFQRIFRDVHPQPFEILPSRITGPFPTPHDSSPSIAPQSPTMQHLDPSVSYHGMSYLFLMVYAVFNPWILLTHLLFRFAISRCSYPT